MQDGSASRRSCLVSKQHHIDTGSFRLASGVAASHPLAARTSRNTSTDGCEKSGLVVDLVFGVWGAGVRVSERRTSGVVAESMRCQSCGV